MILSLQQAAHTALTRHRERLIDRPVSPRELAAAALARYRALGGTASGWEHQARWLDVFRYVINGCRARGWNPRAFVRAVVETVGKHCILHHRAMQPGMFTSEKAAGRFQQWQRHGLDADRNTRETALLVAEHEFARALIENPDAPIRAVERHVRSLYPEWTPTATRRMPHVRLSALVAAARIIDLWLPTTLPAPTGAWTWAEQRERLIGIERERREAMLAGTLTSIDQGTWGPRDPNEVLNQVVQTRQRLVRLGWRRGLLPVPTKRETVVELRRRLGVAASSFNPAELDGDLFRV